MERLISPDFAIFSQKQAKSFEPDASLIESSISIECRTENSDAVLKPACQLRFFKRQDRVAQRPFCRSIYNVKSQQGFP